MAAGILRSFDADHGLVRVLLVGNLSEATLRVRGSDKSTVARVPCGKPIQFELVRDGQGRACAIDVSVI